ncbi:hypothetical protein ACIRRH_15410 [Kitasatospora sp. NPDC101235]
MPAEGVPDSGPLPGGSRRREHPPTGPWRSWKAGKSYRYDLRRVDGDTR